MVYRMHSTNECNRIYRLGYLIRYVCFLSKILIISFPERQAQQNVKKHSYSLESLSKTVHNDCFSLLELPAFKKEIRRYSAGQQMKSQ